MGSFSRASSAQAKAPCVACCKADKGKDDELAQAAATRVAALQGKSLARPSNAAAVPSTAYGGPSGRTGSDCAQQARGLASVVQRFDRYREALPSARAAADLSELGDGAGTAPSTKPCLTRLPVDAAGLNSALGLPPDRLHDLELRNDDSGFRAAMYRDESTGNLILVPRDTQPDSLVDWQTNTGNGIGSDTPQYFAMRNLTQELAQNGQKFDIAGYSKGGGLAQEGGLLSPLSQVRVFNSAGLPDEALAWTGADSFGDLVSRTRAFSAEGDFLTFMNDTDDPGQKILNARFLRRELAGDGPGLNPIDIKVRNPALRGIDDPGFGSAKADYLSGLGQHIDEMQSAFDTGADVAGFPPVRAGLRETLNDSMGAVGSALNLVGKLLGRGAGQPTLANLAQHKMSTVLDALESNVSRDRRALQGFIASCG
jgi:hypothetical protein